MSTSPVVSSTTIDPPAESSPLVAECCLHKTHRSVDISPPASQCCKGFTPHALAKGYFLAAHSQLNDAGDDDDVAAIIELNKRALKMKALFDCAAGGAVDKEEFLEIDPKMEARGQRRRIVEQILMLVIALLLGQWLFRS